MATSFATVTTSALEVSGGPSLFLATGYASSVEQWLRTPACVLPAQDTAFDLHSPLNKFMPGKSRREYLAGASIFSQGDTANSVFYIQSGTVKLTVVSSNGKEAVIAHLTAGSFFGEAAIAGEPQRASSASALQASTIIRIEKMAMLDLLHREPEFAVGFPCAPALAQYAHAVRPCGSSLQFKRKTPRAPVDADGKLRSGNRNPFRRSPKSARRLWPT